MVSVHTVLTLQSMEMEERFYIDVVILFLN